MTVTYTAEVATCKRFGCFVKLLGRWKGSIYKLIWMDVILFLTLYYGINMIYIHILEDNSKRTFESVVYYCASYTSLIPLSFVLGFYVNLVMTRWWEQYITIPWPDSIAVFVSAHVHGLDEGGRVMRRTVMRYVCLCLTIVFTMISPCVKKRFPKLKNLVDAGLLLENEKNIIETMDKSFPKYPKHWMPIVWAASIITRARKEGRIRDDFAVKTIIDELNSFRGLCGTLMYYDFISIPLVYTQVVTIAVYSFFVCTLLAHQWTDSKNDTYKALDFYSPVFITLQFFFYMGWLKVAETLINPFGEDDDDFEVNWMVDRNLQVSYLIVDEMHHEHPELVKDQYWDEIYPNELPYEREVKREYPPEPSTAKYDIEEYPKPSPSKAISHSNSVVENAKSRTCFLNALNQRSQRFNEAFQRFLNNSEEDVTVQTHPTCSLQSVADFENIENITLYASSDIFDIESQIENENIWQKSKLEPVIEEIEEVSEMVDEEEILMFEGEEQEEEQEEEETPSPNGSDSDPFERLRFERQQQRSQRMNNYLERHFGPNFRILTQSLITPKEKKDMQILEEPVTYGKEEDIVKETTRIKWFQKNLTTNLENNKNPLRSNETLTEHEGKSGKVLNILENKEPESGNLLTDTRKSTVVGMQKSDLPTVSSPALNMEHNSQSSLINVNKLNSLKVKETGNIFPYPMDPSISSQIPNLQQNPIEYKIDLQESMSSNQDESFIGNILPVVVEHFERDIPQRNETSTLEQLTLSPSEYELLLQSKVTSPLDSARSISTQSSSLADDWELLYTGSSSVAGEYRVDIEESGNEPNAKQE